jgi:hypothetical protein
MFKDRLWYRQIVVASLAGATACVKTNCPNKHTPFVSGSVDKDAVKAELEGVQAPEFKRKLFAAVDAF